MHLSCKNGLRVVTRFLIYKSYEYGCMNKLLKSYDVKQFTPIYDLALRGYDCDKEDQFRMFRTRLPILRLLILGPKVDQAVDVDLKQ